LQIVVKVYTANPETGVFWFKEEERLEKLASVSQLAVG
jgi:hypothetical protein